MSARKPASFTPYSTEEAAGQVRAGFLTAGPRGGEQLRHTAYSGRVRPLLVAPLSPFRQQRQDAALLTLTKREMTVAFGLGKGPSNRQSEGPPAVVTGPAGSRI
jgi:hypothetical protein